MKVATQSSTPPGTYTMYDARNAVDRNQSTCMRAGVIGRYYPEKTVWWKVDLGRVHKIYSIDIILKIQQFRYVIYCFVVYFFLFRTG